MTVENVSVVGSASVIFRQWIEGMFENDEPIDVIKMVQSSFTSRSKRTML